MANKKRNKLIQLMLVCFIMILADSFNVEAALKIGQSNHYIPSFKSALIISDSRITADSLIKSEISSELREKLAKIHLGYISEPMGEMIIKRDEMADKLGRLASEIEIPEKITIRRTGSFLSGKDVAKEIKNICLKSTSDNLEIDLSRIPTNIILPGNLKNWQVTSNSESTIGMKLFVVTADTDGGSFRQLIQVRVTKIIEVAELIRLSKPGETISDTMIRRKKMEIKSELGNIPISFDEAIGKNLTRFKSAGTVLRSSDLVSRNTTTYTSVKKHYKKTAIARKKELLIRPGDKVYFLFSSGSLSLKVPAKAIQGGDKGDEITLINLQNKRRIKGIVKDKGNVEYAQN